jgi:hypothetical protein
MVNLFYLSGNNTGGWVTFTYHLVKTLEAMNEGVTLYKIGNNTERKARPFGYGLFYQNITIDDAQDLTHEPALIVAAAKQQAEAATILINDGAKVVLHDPTELRAGLAGVSVNNPWVIRRAVQAQVPGSVFIRHPYVRHARPAKAPKRKGAISISRIDFDKHTELLLDANRLGAEIYIRGFENRLYTKFKIVPNYPEWVQSVAHYDRHDPATAFRMLLEHKSMVDMSLIKGDGGGTQYTTLEAWDAGCMPIVHSDWLLPKDDMVPGKNCWTASSGAAIARVVTTLNRGTQAGFDFSTDLRRHSPKVVGPKIMEWLNG